MKRHIWFSGLLAGLLFWPVFRFAQYLVAPETVKSYHLHYLPLDSLGAALGALVGAWFAIRIVIWHQLKGITASAVIYLMVWMGICLGPSLVYFAHLASRMVVRFMH